MFDIMTSRELYQAFLKSLGTIYTGNEAMIITDWVFEKLAGLERFQVVRDPGQPLSVETIADLNRALGALLDHRPVQYVLGEALFYHMTLTVNEQVLVPRPETEELVQLVIDEWGAHPTRPSPGKAETPRPAILDIGTGSGCIAIAMEKHIPGSMVHAIDVSAGALLVAKHNAAREAAAVTFSQLDFLNEQQWVDLPLYDIIVSNPPYIPLNEKKGMDRNVSGFEPQLALFVPDDNPFLFYEKIAAFGKAHLRQNGKIYVEIHENFALQAAAVFTPGYQVVIKKDLYGKDRLLAAVSNQQ